MNIKKYISAPATIALTGVGLGMIGDKLGNDSLSQAGAVSTSFLTPAISLSMGRLMINQLRELKPKSTKEDKNVIQNQGRKSYFKL